MYNKLLVLFMCVCVFVVVVFFCWSSYKPFYFIYVSPINCPSKNVWMRCLCVCADFITTIRNTQNARMHMPINLVRSSDIKSKIMFTLLLCSIAANTLFVFFLSRVIVFGWNFFLHLHSVPVRLCACLFVCLCASQ